MREHEFREQLRGALGEPPPMAGPTLRTPEVGAPRLHPRVMAMVAVTLAILLVVALVGSRLTLHPRGNFLPAGTPGAQTPAAAPDSMPCHLAVDFIQEADNQGGQTATSVTGGFVNIPSGTFQADPSAGSAGGTYSAALRRWLPASSRSLSPDATAYAYVSLLPAGASWNQATGGQLHVVDGATRADRKVWSKDADVEFIDWTSAGILVSATPFQGGVQVLWRIDPTTGHAIQAPPSANPFHFAAPGYPGIHNLSYLGTDSAGQTVFYLGSRDRGTKYYVVLVDASGKATTVYSGTAGDSTNFYPDGFFADAHGIWFDNSDGSKVWLWTQSAGLTGFTVTGAPPPPRGYQFTSRAFMPAGACVPGQFPAP
ncbi:MAG TPA: hypothetical protein VFB69_02795 [Candidatus Dormibacteraeota bacterium]|nr:hypothetical protein [Candidatus Dormibacteraeota bacterium]